MVFRPIRKITGFKILDRFRIDKVFQESFICVGLSYFILYATYYLAPLALDEFKANLFLEFLIFVNLASLIFRYGSERIILRVTSFYENKMPQKTKRFIRNHIFIAFSISVLVTIAIFYYPEQILIYVSENEARFYIDLIWALPLFTINFLISQILRGLKKVCSSIFTQILLPNLLVLLYFVLKIIGFIKGDFLNLFYFASIISSLLFGLIVVWKNFVCQSSLNEQRGDLYSWWDFGYIFVTSITIQFFNGADLVYIRNFVGSEFSGIYGLASKTALIISFGLLFTNHMFGPKAAKLFFGGEQEKLNDLYNQVTKISITFSVLASILIVLFAKIMESKFNFFTSDYTSILSIFLIAQFINASFGSLNILFQMIRKEFVLLVSILIPVLLVLPFYSLLITKIGIYGAAILTSSAVIFWNLALHLYQSLKIGLDYRYKYFFAGLVAEIVLLITLNYL